MNVDVWEFFGFCASHLAHHETPDFCENDAWGQRARSAIYPVPYEPVYLVNGLIKGHNNNYSASHEI